MLAVLAVVEVGHAEVVRLHARLLQPLDLLLVARGRGGRRRRFRRRGVFFFGGRKRRLVRILPLRVCRSGRVFLLRVFSARGRGRVFLLRRLGGTELEANEGW